MKAVRVVVMTVAVSLLFSACTKTVYVTAPVAADTTKAFVVVADNWGDSACDRNTPTRVDIYVNGDPTATMFVHEENVIFTAPSGALLQARQMRNGTLQVQTDTALVADTSSQAYFYASGDTLFWTIY